MTYTVEVRAIDGWTRHSEHESYGAAVNQADLVHGRVAGDRDAWEWARRNQGCTLSWDEWQGQDDSERDEYEAGAAGIGTD